MKLRNQKVNERKFKNWIETETGGRIYTKELKGKFGWKAEYIKEVDENEKTLEFKQNIYNESGILIEVHEKFPIDKGHKKL